MWKKYNKKYKILFCIDYIMNILLHSVTTAVVHLWQHCTVSTEMLKKDAWHNDWVLSPMYKYNVNVIDYIVYLYLRLIVKYTAHKLK